MDTDTDTKAATNGVVPNGVGLKTSKRRENREFRIMYRAPSAISGIITGGKDSGEEKPVQKKPSVVRRKISRMLGHSSSSSSLVDELCAKLAEKSGHWALVILEPETSPPMTPADSKPMHRPRPPVKANDPRIQRVFEISRKERSGGGKSGSKEKNRKGTDKDKDKSIGKVPSTPRPPTPSDSDQEDRHEEDMDCPEENEKGKHLKMQVSLKPRPDFAELQFEHLGGPIWEILTGIEARTKFSNSELKHEANRIWKRQQNYHLMDNNCQQFCILLAITIRAKNHSLLRVLHGQTVKRQLEKNGK